MKTAWFLGLGALAIALPAASLSLAWSDEPTSAARRSVEEARREATLLHSAMHSALPAIHHR
jgi:hypothetical protein